MKQIDITKDIFIERIEKSPPFAKDIIVVFSDDVSVETMRLFSEEKPEKWVNPMLKELVLDWNLIDGKGEKLPFTLEGLDRIKSIKLRNWIIATLQEVILGRLSILKKK